MKRKNMLVVSILTLTVLASSTAMAFADTDTTSSEAARGSGHDGDLRAELNLTDDQKTLLHEARTSDLKEALANLVKAGTFTHAEADALLAAMPTEPKDRGDGLFASLTEAQQTALEAKLDSLKAAADATSEPCHGDRGAIMTEAINALVKDGVLTQKEADTLIANMPAEREDREAGPFQSLTETQRTALESELQTLQASSLKELVSDGTITQAQADILAQMGPGGMGGHGRGDGHR